jgi:hypothetical protein
MVVVEAALLGAVAAMDVSLLTLAVADPELLVDAPPPHAARSTALAIRVRGSERREIDEVFMTTVVRLWSGSTWVEVCSQRLLSGLSLPLPMPSVTAVPGAL